MTELQNDNHKLVTDLMEQVKQLTQLLTNATNKIQAQEDAINQLRTKYENTIANLRIQLTDANCESDIAQSRLNTAKVNEQKLSEERDIYKWKTVRPGQFW